MLTRTLVITLHIKSSPKFDPSPLREGFRKLISDYFVVLVDAVQGPLTFSRGIWGQLFGATHTVAFVIMIQGKGTETPTVPSALIKGLEEQIIRCCLEANWTWCLMHPPSGDP